MMVPSRVEPEHLFRHRPPVDRVMGLEDMEQAIAAGLASSMQELAELAVQGWCDGSQREQPHRSEQLPNRGD